MVSKKASHERRLPKAGARSGPIVGSAGGLRRSDWQTATATESLIPAFLGSWVPHHNSFSLVAAGSGNFDWRDLGGIGKLNGVPLGGVSWMESSGG